MKPKCDCNDVWIGEVRGREIAFSKWLLKQLDIKVNGCPHSCVRSQPLISIGTITIFNPNTIGESE